MNLSLISVITDRKILSASLSSSCSGHWMKLSETYTTTCIKALVMKMLPLLRYDFLFSIGYWSTMSKASPAIYFAVPKDTFKTCLISVVTYVHPFFFSFFFFQLAAKCLKAQRCKQNYKLPSIINSACQLHH